MRNVIGNLIPWLLLCASYSLAQAQNEAILFGGEDEPTTKDNIFQQTFSNVAGAFNSNGWDVQPLFDGDNSHCTDCSNVNSSWGLGPLAAAAGKSPSDIPRASKQALLDKLDSALQKLGPGDQLFIGFNTHGAPAYNHGPGGSISDTVQLAVYDPKNQRPNDGTMLINDPDLTQRFAALKAKGVKLGFGNDSCFGGPAASALAKYGCVVTATDGTKYNLGSPVSDSLVELLTADPAKLRSAILGRDGHVAMDDVYLDVLSRSWQGNNSPYYNLPFAGTMEPEFSGDPEGSRSANGLAHWLTGLKSDYVQTGGSGGAVSCQSPELGPLQDFANQFIVPLLGQADPDHSLETARYFLRNDQMGDNQPASNSVVSPAELASKIANADQAVKAAADRYNSLAGQEQSLLSNLLAANVKVDWQLPADMADAKPALDQAIRALNGKSLNAFPVSSNSASEWLTKSLSYGDSTGPHQKNFFTPDEPMFPIAANNIAQDLAKEMSKTYPQASDPSFVSRLGGVIADAETRAWNSAAPDAQGRLRGIEDIQTARKQQNQVLEAGKGEQFVLENIEARMYAYMAHRNQAPSDPNVKDCTDFKIRDLGSQ